MDQQYKKYRATLVPYAYNITGDLPAAEDVVHEVLNSYFMNDRKDIESPEKYLMRAVINRSINAKKSIDSMKRNYIGQWLPVPVNTEESIYKEIDKQSILDYSLLVLLEKLNPKERAVFILKESFDFDHRDIAEILDITAESSRQLYKRGREKLQSVRRNLTPVRTAANSTLKQLTEAILSADVESVKALLSADVQSYSDGGDIKAARNIIVGRDNVTKFLQALYGKYFHPDTVVTAEEFSLMPALIFRREGIVYRCVLFDIADGVIENVYILTNPLKLRALQS
jgi:RNA polymerase sigma factor (sigma-70 family)